MKKRKPCITQKLFAMISAIALLWSIAVPCVAVGAAPDTEPVVSEPTEIALMSVNDLPACIPEENIAALGHVERLDSDALDGYQFLNRDGTVSNYFFTDNVRYVDENGVVRDKEKVLVRQSDGSYRNTYTDIAMHFSASISDGMTMTFDGISLSMYPFIDPSLPLTDSAIATLRPATDRTTEDRVIYYSVPGFGDIVYTPRYSGVKEDIILSEEPDSADFTFIMTLTDATLVNRGTYVDILNADEEIAGQLQPILLQSANGLQGNGTYSVESAPVPGGKINLYRVTLHADEDFLSSPDVAYPVTVDPTIMTGDPADKNIWDTGFLGPTVPTGVTTGHLTSHKVGCISINLYMKTLYKFPGLMNNIYFRMLPEERLHAVFLYLKHVTGTATNVYMKQSAGTDWTEETPTSELSGNVMGAGPSSTVTISNPITIVDITQHVLAWKYDESKSDLGLTLENMNNSNMSYCVEFYSTDATVDSNKPYIVMNTSSSYQFTIKNYCSDGFRAGVGANSATYVNGVTSFIQKIFQDEFGVTIVNGGIVNRTSLIDQCPKGVYEACDTTCSTSCSNHHRNLFNYTNDIYELNYIPNEVRIAWDYASRLTICKNIGGHTTASIMGVTCGMPEDRGCMNDTYFHDMRNVASVFEPSLSFDANYFDSHMKLIAAHEFAHVMGIRDVYELPAETVCPIFYPSDDLDDPNTLVRMDEYHDINSESWTCIMRNFNHSDEAAAFVDRVEAGEADPFCEFCQRLISAVINTRCF